MIVKYNLEANGTVPTYIADGGYFPKANGNASPQDLDLIGHTVNDDIPETVTVLDRAALITRLIDLEYRERHYVQGTLQPEDKLLTNEEIEAVVDNFIG